MNLKEFLTGYKGKDIPDELKEFNWGAFLLTFIWGIRFKAPITLLALPLIYFQLPLGLNWILYTVLQIYCGIKGNEWAYQEEWWKKPADFRITQAKWAITALSLNILIPFILLIIAARFVQKDLDNPMKYIQNAQCSISYNKIKRGLSKIILTNNTTEREIAKQFASLYKNANLKDNAVNFTVKSGNQNIETYTMVFTKHNIDKPCTLTDENCYIKSSYIVPTDVMSPGECTFYFDNGKKIMPDTKTQEALNKGLNIFKYL